MNTIKIIISLLVVNCVGASAQTLTWANYTNKDQITSLESFAGAVWATTTGGVVRLSITRDTVITYLNSDGLGSSNINFACYDGSRFAYFGSADGVLSRLDLNTSAFRFEQLRGRDGERISLNDADTSGDYLWIASSIGVIKYDRVRNGGEVKETYRTLGGFATERSVAQIAVAGGRVHAILPEGVAFADVANEFLLDPNEWYFFEMSVSPLCLASFDGRAYIGRSDGVYRLGPVVALTPVFENSGAVTIQDLVPSATDLHILFTENVNPATAALIGSLNSAVRTRLSEPFGVNARHLTMADVPFYGTTNDGLYAIEGALSGDLRIVVPGPASNDLVGGGFTTDGRLHVVSAASEISTLQDGVWTHRNITERNKIAALVDRSDNLWIATFGDGAYRVNPDGSAQHFGPANSPLIGIESAPEFSVVNCLSEDPSGRIWFSLFQAFPLRPMVVFDQSDSLWTHFGDSDDLIEGDNQVIAAGNGSAALGVNDQGIAFLRYGNDPFNHSDDQLGYFARSRRLPSNVVTALTYDRNNRLWVGTNQGLAWFDDEIDFFVPVSLPLEVASFITSITADSRNNLWVGTSGGLALLPQVGDPVGLTTMNSDLVSNEIENLVYDNPSEQLLIFTRGGLSILDFRFDSGSGADGVVAYPNPFPLNESTDRKLQFRIDQPGDIRIFTVAGDLVATATVNGGWNGRNDSGELVASGVYIWEIHAVDGSRHRGKILVIRR